MMRRPRRVLPSSLVALALLVVAVLVAVSCVQVLLGHQPVLPLDALARTGATVTWSHPLVLAAGVVLAVLGLVLLAIATLPGRPTVLPLTSPCEGTRTGVTRHSLRREVLTTIAHADGVSTTRVSVRRRRIRVRVHTLGQAADIGDQVRSLLTYRLAQIDLAHQPRLRVRARPARRS